MEQLQSIALDEINVEGVQYGTRCHDIFFDNLSAINISKNHVHHSRIKHIDIRHHFIMELVEDKVVALEHMATEKQLTDIFTKALDIVHFEKLKGAFGVCICENQQQSNLGRRAKEFLSLLVCAARETKRIYLVSKAPFIWTFITSKNNLHLYLSCSQKIIFHKMGSSNKGISINKAEENKNKGVGSSSSTNGVKTNVGPSGGTSVTRNKL